MPSPESEDVVIMGWLCGDDYEAALALADRPRSTPRFWRRRRSPETSLRAEGTLRPQTKTA
jgi:hypothetical protein